MKKSMELLEQMLKESRFITNLLEKIQNLETKLSFIENSIPKTEKVFYTVKEILSEFKISRRTFYLKKKIFELKSVGKLGRFEIYHVRDVIRFLHSSKSLILEKCNVSAYVSAGR